MRTRLLIAALGTALSVGTVGAATGATSTVQISVDPLTNSSGQHETAVEPDSFAAGATVVTAFQVGRIVEGGASGIGWGTSTDGGATWRRGLLPALTVHQAPAGPYSRVSDPSVAYDRAHGAWVVAVLALRDAPGDALSSVVVSRSPDGLLWSQPVVTAPEVGRFDHDKPWLACDNGAGSPFLGRCYLTWTTNPGQTGVLAVATSTNGGVTWSAPATFGAVLGSGWQPVVRPDGSLVIVYEGARAIEAVRSTDGGRSFSRPVVVGAIRAAAVPGMRAEALPSADADADGTVATVWQDCRFRAGCGRGTAPNDIVFATSADGLHWSRVRRVRTWPELEGLTHFVPAFAVDPATRGDSARLALTFYVLTPRGCGALGCRVQPVVVASPDGGRTWSAPEALAPAQPVVAFPLSTSGRFVGDYISTSFTSGGVAIPVFASATAAPDATRFHQAVFAARVPSPVARDPLLRVGAAVASPRVPRVGARVVVSARVAGAGAGTVVTCTWRGSRVRLRRLESRVAAGRARCAWQVRAAAAGARVTGSITVLSPEEEGTRPFEFRVRPL